MKRTKIICTLGPASSKKTVLKAMMRAGMDIARFNFSHGSHEEHRGRVDMIKNLREELNIPVAMLLDTKGPEIRTKLLKDHKKVMLETGSEFTLTTGDIEGDETRVAITYENLHKDVKKGGKILIDDGLIELEIENIKNCDIVCRVLNGGELGERKGINVPYVKVKLPGITEQDKADILFGIQQEFDYIAASFVRDAKAIREIRQLLDENGGQDIGIIAKIENAEGVENIDEIIKAADGIMVARGDLGVEIPPSEVPYIQKMIIRKCNENYVPVITATQMLDSMMKNPRPTRAETSDVANAIYQGTSAIMLSGETAAGAYPIEAVQTMAKIAERTEQDIDYSREFKPRKLAEAPDVTSAISHATCTTAADLKAAAIVAVSKSGRTVSRIAKYLPVCPIIGCTTDERVYRQLNLLWGVTPVVMEEANTADELFDHAVELAEQKGLIARGELVVIAAGVPVGLSGTTNMMKVQIAGNALVTGKGANKLKASGNVCVCSNDEDLEKKFRAGDIVVVEQTTNEMVHKLKDAAGIITETGDRYSHAAVVGMTLEIPVITSARNATRILKSGTFVTMDAEQGIVYNGR